MDVKIPFIKLLKSPYHCYFFDVNTNKIVPISEEGYYHLEQVVKGKELLDTNDEEIQSLMEDGYLSNKRVMKIEHPNTAILANMLDSQVHLVTLQLTQMCNFRCSYCIYSEFHNERQRSHSAKRMSFEIAKKAIDFLVEHSRNASFPMIGLYGGEPLLEFDLIKQIIPYAEDAFEGREVGFVLTTNASLLTEQVADYLAEKNVHITISLDGPENIQNINRRFAANGKGSFSVVEKNLKYIKSKYPEWFREFNISMVIDPQNDYDEINALFAAGSIFQENKLTSTIVDNTYSLQKTVYSENYQVQEEYHTFLAFIDYLTNNHHPYAGKRAESIIKLLLLGQENMNAIMELPNVAVPGGACIPGKSRLFVDVNGNFFPCERVSESNTHYMVGNVSDGFDVDRIQELINFAKSTEQECKNCWAFLHCKLCLKHTDNNGKFDSTSRLSLCNMVKSSVENDLLSMIMLQECRSIYRQVKKFG